MPIPDSDTAFVPTEKLREYLLNLTHPVGGPKARWLLVIGYDLTQLDRLRSDLLEIVRTSGDYSSEDTQFGIKWVVSGQLQSPTGVLANVRTVWIKEPFADGPRFVTAYPDRTLTE